ncbi:MAG: DUF6062 family protein [Anaerolineales bacterium]|jgi:hypothetical protein
MSIKNITYLDLIEACQKPGCLACTLTQEMVESYIRMLFHEHINDPPSRDKLRYSQGLCYQHIWLAIDGQLGNALGVAIISNDVVGKLLQDLNEIKFENNRLTKFRKLMKPSSNPSLLTPEKDCPVCQHQNLVEERVLKTLVATVQRPELSAAIRESDGICLPHLRQALEMDASVQSHQILLDLARDRWEKLADELSEFIRKNDYRFSKEGFGSERDSWLRATGVLTGNRPKKAA